MDRLRRTLSFRSRKKKRKAQLTESSKPHQWQEDERKVREGTCSFQVKYLGCMEVFESRGMQVCEDAHKVLRQNAKKPHRLSFRKKTKNRQKAVQAIIYVSGDSFRVIEDKAGVTTDDGQGLIVDQTIEKVSFCAPDRNYEKGFAYICRDGTSRRWMCHGFLALKESGERLSHAVGCAFAVCLEKKQKREKETVSVSYNDDKTSFARLGSFRQATLTERLADPQSTKLVEPIALPSSSNSSNITITRGNVETAQVERPHASANLLLRQGSFNTFNKLNSQTSPFKRNLSLRLNELPSNLTRQQTDFNRSIPSSNVPIIEGEEPLESPKDASLASALTDMPPTKQAGDVWDPIAEMCQQLTKGLTGLHTENSTAAAAAAVHQPANTQQLGSLTAVGVSDGANPMQEANPWGAPAPQENDFWLPPTSKQSTIPSASPPLSSILPQPADSPALSSPHVRPRPTAVAAASLQQQQHSPQRIPSSGVVLPNRTVFTSTTTNGRDGKRRPTDTSTNHFNNNIHSTNGGSPSSAIGILSPPSAANSQNPFDTAWALRNNTSTNPFLSNTVSTAGGPTSVTGSGTRPATQTQFSKEFELTM